MKKMTFIFMIVSLSFGVLAKAQQDYETIFKPKSLQAIDWYKTSDFKTYEKALGQVSSKEGDAYYYEVNGLKYPISIHKKKDSDKIEKVYFRVLGDKPDFSSLTSYLKDNEFTLDAKTESKDFRTYISKKRKLKLNFSSATKKLYSVEKWF